MVLLATDVIVDVDLDRFDGDIAIGDAPVVTPVPGGPTAQTPRVGYRAAALDGRSLSSFNKARMHWFSSASEKKV